MKKLLLFFLALLCGCDALMPSKRTHLTIGTGGLTGVYYPTGQAISKLVNHDKAKHNLKAQAESTAGSVYNINALLNGELEIAVAQADRVYQAYKGQKEWSDIGPQTDLRSLYSLHSEVVTLVASEKSGIRQLVDAKGKRVNLGNIGSGQLENAKDALNAFGIDVSEIEAEYIKAVEAPGLIQDERLDAFFYTSGHPNGNIKEAVNGHLPVRLVPLSGPEIDQLITKQPYYTPASIPLKFYTNEPTDEVVDSFGVKALIITRAQVSDEIAYWITKEVFENLEQFKGIHPAFTTLNKTEMLKGMFAPLHPGAIKYYKEIGIEIPPHLIPAP